MYSAQESNENSTRYRLHCEAYGSLQFSPSLN